MSKQRCDDCKEEIIYPEDTYDTASPIDWVLHVQRETGLPAIGIVWRYGPDDGLLGRPAAVCGCGRKLLYAYSQIS